MYREETYYMQTKWLHYGGRSIDLCKVDYVHVREKSSYIRLSSGERINPGKAFANEVRKALGAPSYDG